jgi:hypothetical protein
MRASDVKYILEIDQKTLNKLVKNGIIRTTSCYRNMGYADVSTNETDYNDCDVSKLKELSTNYKTIFGGMYYE